MDTSFLSRECSLPQGTTQDQVVQWRVFRSREQAQEFLRAYRLGHGQRVVGGYSRDSVGPFWWVGVQVEDLSQWGNRAAVNKHAW